MNFTSAPLSLLSISVFLAGPVFATELNTPRLEGADNFRDVAGTTTAYSTSNDGEMRAGVFYRSNGLSTLTAADISTVQDLGVTTILDLRKDSEVASAPNPSISGIENIRVDIAGQLMSDNNVPVFSDASAAIGLAGDSYRQMVSSASSTQSFGLALRELALSDGAAIFHCTAGRDRTGLVTYFLQTIAGVSEEDKLANYVATNAYSVESVKAALEAYEAVNPDIAKAYAALMTTEGTLAVLQAGLDEIVTDYGSVSNYIQYGMGLDQATIYVLRGKMVSYNSLPGLSGFNGNSAAGAKLLLDLQDSSLSGSYTAYNYFLQSAIDAGDLRGMEQKVGGQVIADAASFLLRQPANISASQPLYASGFDLKTGESRAWLNGLSSYVGTDGAGGHSSSNEHLTGTQLGASHRVNENLAVRGAFSYGNGSVGSAGGNVDLDLTQGSVGIRYAFDRLENGLFVDAEASAGYVDYQGKRDLGDLGTARGDTHGGLYSASGAVGYRFATDSSWIEPRLGLSASRLNLSGFQEKGSELALDVKQTDESRTSVISSVSMGTDAGSIKGWGVRPALVIGYDHVIDGSNVKSNGSVLGYGVTQTAAFDQKDIFSAGLDVQASRGDWTLGLAINGRTGGDSHGVDGSLNVGLKF
ncbi:tyrosine-protein phosphatase [Pseudomonas putida]|uniref:tyrosine-protein phosphatase n=1 Tax=Pseudomonas putida TaxID=303 RepID=UPI003360C2BB